MASSSTPSTRPTDSVRSTDSLNATETALPTGAARSKRRPAAGAVLLRWARLSHLYLGLFISPALLFFAITGALQTLSLHEAAGTSYQPPAWVARLGQIHKKQTSQLRPHRPAPQPAVAPANADRGPGNAHPGPSDRAGASERPGTADRPAAPVALESKLREHLPLKLFFVLVSLGLLWSTVTGIYMAYRFGRNPLLVSATLVAGLLIPLLLLRF